MEQHNNQLINHNPNESLAHSNSLTVSDRELTKCIGQNIYLLGYTGGPDQLVLMANKLKEIFGNVNLRDLKHIFNDYHSGHRELKYSFNISHISKGLISLGYKTVQDQINELNRDEFYSFQEELLNPGKKD